MAGSSDGGAGCRSERDVLEEKDMKIIDGGALTYVNPAVVKIDRYQRSLEVDRVEKISANFNHRLFDPVLLSKRKDGYFVIDGQHRIRAAQAANIKSVPARVLFNVTREEEANLFVDAQLGRKSIHSLDRFNAKVIAGDPAYMAVSRTLKAHKFQLAHHSATNVPGRLRCITLLMTIFQGRGEAHFKRLILVLRELSVDKETGHLSDAFIRPLSTLLYKAGEKMDVWHFTKVFKKVSIEKLVWKSIRKSKVRGGRCVDKMIHSMVLVYNQSNPPKKIVLSDKRSKKS